MAGRRCTGWRSPAAGATGSTRSPARSGGAGWRRSAACTGARPSWSRNTRSCMPPRAPSAAAAANIRCRTGSAGPTASPVACCTRRRPIPRMARAPAGRAARLRSNDRRSAGRRQGNAMSIRRELFAGEVLYRQGDPSDCAWLIESGQVELVSVQGRRTARHGVLGTGELIGELGLLDGAPRSATATARSDCRLLAIEREQFLERLQAGDPILRTLVDSLLQRIRGLVANMPAEAPMPAEDVACDDPVERSGIDKIRLEAQLRDALDAGTLEVRYQPIYDVTARRVTGYEALVRWALEGRGPVSPAEFIQLAEETSLIVPVGEYVLDRVVAVLQALRDGGADP